MIDKCEKNTTIFATLCGLALLTNLCSAEIVFNETFEKGREEQNPPESLAWFATVAESASVENGAVTLTGATESARALIASFPMVSLETGDQLVLTFNLTLAGEVGYANDAMRVGLYYAEQTPFADGENPEAVATGYLVSLSNSRHTGSQETFTGNMFFERLVDGQQKANPKLTAYQNHFKIAALWAGFVAHSHYDGVVETWPHLDANRASARSRLSRLGIRPVWISQERSTSLTKQYLESTGLEICATFVDLPYPNHTDAWVLRDLPERQRIRQWIADVVRA